MARQANALRVVDLDAQALALGLEPGLTLADARAQVPGLESVETDPSGVRRRLETLADFCRRYTPAVALDPPDGLYLDVTGCRPLFGEEPVLVGDLVRRFERSSVQVRVAVADTPACARALSRHAPGTFAPRDASAEALERLPPSAVLGADVSGVLVRLGLRTIGRVLDLPRPALARCLGPADLARLDEAVGLRPSPLLMRLEVPPYAVERRLAEPIILEEHVLREARNLASRLESRLEGEGLGGRRFNLELFRMDGSAKRLAVDVGHPLRNPGRIAALFAERLAGLNEGLEADFGFDVLRLTAERVDALTARTVGFNEVGADDAVANFVDRVNARFGAGRVARLTPDPRTRLPENAVRTVGVAVGAVSWADQPRAVCDGTLLRPLRLFDPPEEMTVIAAEAPEGAPAQFRWRRVVRRVVKAEGPERLASEWWRERAALATRDYYRVEDDKGLRYWVFRQGVYAETPEPCWFVHGLFP